MEILKDEIDLDLEYEVNEMLNNQLNILDSLSNNSTFIPAFDDALNSLSI
jgi:hypothetical protein